MSPEEARRAKVEPLQRTLYLRIDNGKANFQPPADKARWVHLASVTLGNATPTLPADEMAAAEPYALPDPMAGVSSHIWTPSWPGSGTRVFAEHPRAGDWIGRELAPIVGLDPVADANALQSILQRLHPVGALERGSRIRPKDKREQPTLSVGRGPPRTYILIFPIRGEVMGSLWVKRGEPQRLAGHGEVVGNHRAETHYRCQRGRPAWLCAAQHKMGCGPAGRRSAAGDGPARQSRAAV